MPMTTEATTMESEETATESEEITEAEEMTTENSYEENAEEAQVFFLTNYHN